MLYNYYREPWLIAKIDAMLDATLRATADRARCTATRKAILAAGPLVDALDGGPPPGDTVDPVPERRRARRRRPATDDWPFLYLRTPFIAPHYLAAPGVRARCSRSSASLGAARVDAARRPPVQPALLRARHRVPAARDAEPGQLQPAVRDDVARQRPGVLRDPRQRAAGDPRQRPAPSRRPAPLYAALLLSLLVACALPPDVLLIDPPGLRYVLAAALAFAPVFFANLVFTYSFRDTDRPTWPSPPTCSARWPAAPSSTSRCSPATGAPARRGRAVLAGVPAGRALPLHGGRPPGAPAPRRRDGGDLTTGATRARFALTPPGAGSQPCPNFDGGAPA